MASLLDVIKHYQNAIEKCPDDEQRVLRCINKLHQLDVTVQHLQDTGVGRTVNALRKIPGDVGNASRALVNKWKLMVAAEENSDPEDYKHESNLQNGYKDDYSDDHGEQSSNENHDYSHLNSNRTSSKSNNSNSNSQVHNKRKLPNQENEQDVKKFKHSHKDIETPSKVANSHGHTSDRNKDSDESQDDPSDSDGSDNKLEIKQDSSENSDSKSYDKHHSRHTHSSKDKHIDRDKHSSSKFSNDKSKSHSTDLRSRKSESYKKENKDTRRESKSHDNDKQTLSKTKEVEDRSKYKTHHSKSDHKESSRPHKSKEKHEPHERSHTSKKKKESQSSSSKERIKEQSSSKDSSSHSHRSKERDRSSDIKNKSSSSSEKEHKKKSSSSHSNSSKNSSSKHTDNLPKKNRIEGNSEDSDDGIDCGSGASFAEALGMISPVKKNKEKEVKRNKPSNKEMSANLSPLNIFSRDISPLSLLTSPNKLPPLPPLEISSLPEISPNYRPRPPPKLLPHNISEDDAMSAVISSKNQRTKVYSGNKTVGHVSSLYELCVQVLHEHIDAMEYTGGVPYEILKPVVDKATPDQLFVLEHYNAYLMNDTDHLWQKHCEKHFRNKKRQEMETWREMYMRCQEEQEHKLRSLTANIKMAQDAKNAPVKQTKMAYVDSVVKPPRNIARKQAIHGTARLASASPAARVASLSTAPNVGRVGAVRPPPATPTAAFIKPKKAPLMQKALQFMRGKKR